MFTYNSLCLYISAICQAATPPLIARWLQTLHASIVPVDDKHMQLSELHNKPLAGVWGPRTIQSQGQIVALGSM